VTLPVESAATEPSKAATQIPGFAIVTRHASSGSLGHLTYHRDQAGGLTLMGWLHGRTCYRSLNA